MKDEGVDIEDRHLDVLRYYLMRRPQKPKPQEEESAVKRDKERRIRKLRNACRARNLRV
jgi:hypothetical protein